ncbi:M50 family metallopeptidase [Paenibacillus beijingensis]|uniref:Membrane protein n=1 Tax=Paenibacillus beijingensis TaxID=1126833 RepID=A0A0D5NI82_9BACL|nr:M50 family metallopeptidase [Paenibacillus beijingensis]AJY74672.1 membrane protein [Paenibacillus beijingensis]
MNRWLKTVLFLAVSIVLTRLIPFSSFFRNVNTMVHEFCHALLTLLMSGRVSGIQLHADHSGVTYSYLSSWWSLTAVSLAGYIGASLFSLLLFALYFKRRERTGLLLITAIALLMIVFWVHEGFGVWWLAGFIGLNAAIYFFAPAFVHWYYVLLAFIMLEESVLGPFYLLQYALLSPGQAGDAANMRQLTGIPALVWALLFVVVSLWCAVKSVAFFGKIRAPKTARTVHTETRQRPYSRD